MTINLDSLSGSKSYITAAAGGLVVFAQNMGFITQDEGTKILEFLALMYAVFLRQAVAKTAQITQLNPNAVKPEVNTAISQGALVIPDGKPKPKGA